MIKKMFLAIMAIGIFTTSCSSDDDDNKSTNANITLDLQGLGELGDGYVYEGWVIVDGTPVSTGVFSSVSFPQTFSINAEQLENATQFALSIEPAVDSDPTPSKTKLLIGSFSGNSANVNSDVIGNFNSATGAFFLRSPTDETGTNNGNDEYGVWFGTPGMPPTPNFVLPTLPEGWAYEGWVIGENGPITTGKFSAFDGPDWFDDYSETEQPGPPVPGEDFFINAPAGETFPLDVRGRTVAISVEPIPDDNPSAPFAIKPLLGTAGQETAPATHSFNQNLGSLPSGTVTR